MKLVLIWVSYAPIPTAGIRQGVTVGVPFSGAGHLFTIAHFRAGSSRDVFSNMIQSSAIVRPARSSLGSTLWSTGRVSSNSYFPACQREDFCFQNSNRLSDNSAQLDNEISFRYYYSRINQNLIRKEVRELERDDGFFHWIDAWSVACDRSVRPLDPTASESLTLRVTAGPTAIFGEDRIKGEPWA